MPKVLSLPVYLQNRDAGRALFIGAFNRSKGSVQAAYEALAEQTLFTDT